jgi:hypothetical protein
MRQRWPAARRIKGRTKQVMALSRQVQEINLYPLVIYLWESTRNTVPIDSDYVYTSWGN